MLPGASLIRLSHDTIIKPFDCGDCDLNEFLLNDSKHYLNQLLAYTYIFESDNQTIAFYSVFNDRIDVVDTESKAHFISRFHKDLPGGKKFRSYPAVKIGRFGITLKYQGQGFGSEILDYIKVASIKNNPTACRYITVDAYKQSLRFYEKNGFDYLTTKDNGRNTRQMFFDLTPIRIMIHEQESEKIDLF
jgi:GNAT superfamily N-acetyltransferase